MPEDPHPWCVAIFTSREAPDVLLNSVRAALSAAAHPTCIDVLVNGNRVLADHLCPLLVGLTPLGTSSLRLWFLPLGDKAATFNRYVHEIWPGSALAFFVDGYVRVRPDAFSRISEALHSHPAALAASGVPNTDFINRALRQQMLREGGMHGNLYALSRDTLERMRAIGYRLPLGIYRTDPTLAAALSFNLDPSQFDWQLKERIATVEGASWDIDRQPWWFPSELRGRWLRRARQAQGVLENRAVRHHFAQQRRSPAALPETAAELVSSWAADDPKSFEAAMRRRGLRAAWQSLKRGRDWSARHHSAELLFSSHK